MKKKPATTPALSTDALLGKSKTYVARALAAKRRKEMGEYQLWASLALELLGKAALANIHPCLVADPQSSVSLFAAAGMNIGTDIKTIIAKTLFERLTHVSKRFDQKTQEFCVNMSLKRNSELHSGEAPFEAIAPSWEGRYWHTADIILEAAGSTIEAWLGADQAKAPKDLLSEYNHALAESAKVKVETAAEKFAARPRKERKEAHAKAAGIDPWQMRRSFSLVADEIWGGGGAECPACKSQAFLAGSKYNEEVSDDQDEESDEELVDIYYVAEEFRCPSCRLHLDNRDSIEAVGLEVDHVETDTRLREYEPDYGND